MARVTKAPDVRKQELLDIGFELYMQHGMSGLNIKDVVGRAGVATGLFYYYFKSKEDFADQALNNFIVKSLAGMEEMLEDPETEVLQKIESTLSVFWAYAEKMQPYKGEAAYHTPQHYTLTNKLLQQMHGAVLQVVEQGAAAGVLHAPDPALSAGYILYGLSSVFSEQVQVSASTKEEVNKLVFTTLGIEI